MQSEFVLLRIESKLWMLLTPQWTFGFNNWSGICVGELLSYPEAELCSLDVVPLSFLYRKERMGVMERVYMGSKVVRSEGLG